MRIFTRFIVFVFVIMMFSSLFAQFKVNVDQGEMSDYAVAVSDFVANGKNADPLAKKLTQVIKRDLELAGYFNVLNSKSFLEKPEIAFNKVDFKNWLNVGAQGLIKATISGTKEKELEIVFFNVAEGKKLLHKKYRSNPKTIRKAVHKFVKELVYLLAGVKLKFLNSRIAFIQKSGGKYNLITADFDGANSKVIYSSSKIALLPEWSADGKKIYFTSYSQGNPNMISIDLKSGKRKTISSYPGLNTSASSSPDNKNIAIRLSKDGNAEIYLLNTATRKLKRLTKSMAIDTAPSFSPNGKEIAFVSNRSGNPHIYRLFVNNPSRVERLTVQGKYNQDPDYSPDGKYIAFTGRDEFYKFDIFLFEVATRVITRVTQKQGKNENPSFSPEGRLVLFTSDRRGRNALYITNVKGDKQIRIYSGKGKIITPSWSPELLISN